MSRPRRPGVSWSPYYKNTAQPVGNEKDGMLLIKANGVPHQIMAPAQWKLEQGERIYEAPYLRSRTTASKMY